MSLPNYLAKIKSAGIYRFVWDKSTMEPATAETLRLVVGYSEKGPFNTPVYLDKASDFTTIFGNINKKLERKGIFFHRLALQALAGGPILALNLKPFTAEGTNAEKIEYINFNPSDILKIENITPTSKEIVAVYDTNRFWHLDADQLPSKFKTKKYLTISHTDTIDRSCSLIIRPVNPMDYNVTIREWYASVSADEMPAYLEPIQNELVSKYFADVYVFRGQFNYDLVKKGGALGNYITQYDEEGNVTEQKWNGYFSTADDKSFHINTNFVNSYGEKLDALDALANDTTSNFIQSYRGCLIPYFKDGFGNYISLDILFNRDHQAHNMLMKLDETILDDAISGVSLSDEDKKEAIEDILYCEDVYETIKVYVDVEGVKDEALESWGEKLDVLPNANDEDAPKKCVVDGIAYELVEKTSEGNVLKPIYIKGYTYNTIGVDDKATKLQNKILAMLDDKGIYTALTNRVDVDYHYIVDTFQSYVATGCKAKLAGLAKEKDNAFAIINFPSMTDFINNGNFNSNGKFDIAKIASAKNGFSLPAEVDGASHCGFFTGLTFSDGTVKTNVPSAAIVSNNFMKKHDGNLKPYHIIAGPIRGLVSYSGMIGPDYNYGRSDLDVLEPLGVNAIIYVPRKGTYINSNQTAKQTPVSALSKIHIRELVIYIQNEIENMLQSYQWELNTQTLRDTIKTNADYLLGKIMADGGIYAYSTVCDSSNNTPEVIDNEMLILDIAIEPARGAGKMVQQLTIHKTGGITSTATA